ncbi:hypothetical protein [Embleya sp. NPDC001921]
MTAPKLLTGLAAYHQAAEMLAAADNWMARGSSASNPIERADAFRRVELLTAGANAYAQLATAAVQGGLLADRYVGDGEHVTEWARLAGHSPLGAHKYHDGAPF